MNLSHYCKVYPFDNAGEILLFSTKKASSVLLPKTMLVDIKKGVITDEEKATLTDLGFLVAGMEEEKKEMISFIADLNALRTVLKATVVMNLDCNLNCSYCFEGTRKGSHYMTRETADLLVDFVRKNSEGVDEIRLVFYGGEPLLSKDLIAYIARKVHAFAKEGKKNFNFCLTTNGTLLTRETVEVLRPLGLVDASVTIDGPADVHDSYRPYKSGRGSFDVIFRNIAEVCDLIGVQVAGNFTRGNYTEFPRLLDQLLENEVGPARVTDVRFDPVTAETEGVAPPDFKDGCHSVNEPWLFEALIFLREEILKRGYKSTSMRPSPCMAQFRSNFVINYDGSLFKCPGLIGREGFKVGDIRTGIADYSMSHNLDSWKNAECLACVYLPLCFGGCRYSKFIRDGNMDGVDCRKPYYDATLEALVRQDIKYGLVGGR